MKYIDGKNTIRISREDLYKNVWETPITKLAEQYGVSDRGLAKICNRSNIPTPGRGYWARKVAGKHVIQYKLPDPDENTPGEVVISEYGGLPQPKPEIQASLSKTIEENPQFAVPERMTSPHPVIKAWLDEYKKRKAEEKAEKRHDPFSPDFSAIYKVSTLTSVDRRRHRILHVLFSQLEKQGYTAKSESYESAFLEYQGIRLEFTLREKLKQERRPLTKEEQSSYFYRDKSWVQELKPTGKLQFSIKTHIESGLRHEWNETTKKTMEEHLTEIVALLTLAGPILVEKAQEREEAERRYREEKHERYLKEVALKKDQDQWQQFLVNAEAWQQAEIARQFIAELEKNSHKFEQDMMGDRTLGEWLKWAREWANKTDPTKENMKDLFVTIAAVNSYSW